MGRQSSMTLNDSNDWVDVEADEVTVRRMITCTREAMWVCYLGLVRRGAPHTLIMLRLEDRITKKRSPGILAIHRVDQSSITSRGQQAHHFAHRWSQGLHSGTQRLPTRSRKGKMASGLNHDIWIGTLSLLAGTEVIDGLWKHNKSSIKHVSNPSADLDDCVRVAQWRYWSQGQCPWEALGAISAPPGLNPVWGLLLGV
eukprot:5272619-Amphidinium_carterae.1